LIAFDDFATLPDGIDLLHQFGELVGLHEDDAGVKIGKIATGADVVDSTAANHTETLQNTATAAPVSSRAFKSSDTDTTMIDLEDHLPELGEDDIDHVQKTDSFWLVIEGKQVHKASAVQYLLYSEEGCKSMDRPSRAVGMKKIWSFSRNPDSPSLNDDSLIGDKFLLNQLVTTFIRSNNVLTLAIL
jgi:hypothetical protein